VLSPSKELDLGDTPCRKSSKDENDKNHTNVLKSMENDVDSGFISRVSGMKIEEKPKSTEEQAGYRPIKSRTQLFPSSSASSSSSAATVTVAKPVLMRQDNVILEPSIPSVFQKSNRPSLQKTEEAMKLPPRRFGAESRLSLQDSAKAPPDPIRTQLSEPSHETPFKKNEQPMFVTPSIKQVTTTTKKNVLQALPLTVEKKQPPKILFTTPISRPPPGMLVETPKELIKKLSPIIEPSIEKVPQQKERVLTINKVEYVIEKKIGAGGSSSVFLARSRKTRKECAIKVVQLDGDQTVIDGYLNETKLLAKLQGNVNVVSLFDYCHLPERSELFMVMEKGESDLHKTLQSYKTHIPLYTLTKYWYQMLQAVNYIHQNGVIHSDLKPANFLMIQGRLKLIDFGIASNIAIDSTSIIKFSQAGTFNYISPEALIDTSNDSESQQPKIRLSTKSDVWSLGCILYLLLYKKTPFSHMKVVHQKVAALTNPKTAIDYPGMPSFYPPILVEMVKRCLVHNPKERVSVADLLKYPFEMIMPIDK